MIIYTFACYASNDGELQLSMASWLSLFYSFIMVMVLFGIIYDGATENWQSATFLFFVSLAGINVIAGIIHFDFYALICGIVYFLFIPRIEFSVIKIHKFIKLSDLLD